MAEASKGSNSTGFFEPEISWGIFHPRNPPAFRRRVFVVGRAGSPHNEIMSWTLLVSLLILLALATPERLARGSWQRLFTTMGLTLIVVVIPLFVYFVSSFMVYDLRWKGACRFGWLDCFILSKLAFAPFVLMATHSLYRLEVLGEKKTNDRWLVLGIYVGAIISVTCAVFGLACLSPYVWLLVPLYVAAWYVFRAGQLMRRSALEFGDYVWMSLATIPCWVTAWFWAKLTYDALPDSPPQSCFVVTAAGRGHPQIVGPFLEFEHRGQLRHANQQLVILWRFENLWRERFPGSQRVFRCGYNWLGPRVASCIRSPWRADAVFYLLKPVEWFARFCLRRTGD